MKLGIDHVFISENPSAIHIGILEHFSERPGHRVVRILPSSEGYSIHERLKEHGPSIATLETPEAFQKPEQILRAVQEALLEANALNECSGVALASESLVRPSHAPDFWSLDLLSSHLDSLKWVELPINLLEVNALFESNQTGLQTLTEYLSKSGLPLHIRRPFDSFVGGKHIRWVGTPSKADASVAARVQILLKTVIELEMEASRLSLQPEARAWGHTLGQQFQTIQGSWHWKQILNTRILPERDLWCNEVSSAGYSELAERYRHETTLLFEAIQNYFEAQEGLFAEKILSTLSNKIENLPQIQSLEELSLKTLLALVRPEALYIEEDLSQNVSELISQETFTPDQALEVLEHVRAFFK